MRGRNLSISLELWGTSGDTILWRAGGARAAYTVLYPCPLAVVPTVRAFMPMCHPPSLALTAWGAVRAVRAVQELELVSGTKGCAYCGGLGHRIADCPKLRQDTREQSRKRQDRFGGGSGFGAEM